MSVDACASYTYMQRDMRLYAMQFYLAFAIIPLQAAHAPRPDVFTAKYPLCSLYPPYAITTDYSATIFAYMCPDESWKLRRNAVLVMHGVAATWSEVMPF
jgi:hypothetical protein